MHVPDGFIDAPVSVATGVVAAAAIGVSLRGARRELTAGEAGGLGADRTAPLAGLVAAFIFAVQMLNFPVAAGTSGHLLGGALAAILVGPYTGILCVSVVLLMQGVLFADGGLTALGVNITTMGVVTVVVAYAVFRGLLAVLPRTRRSVTAAAFAGALLSVPAAASFFTLLYALGGTTDVPVGKVFTAMAGVHTLIGIGEGAITAATVGAVLAVRPDLVHGARGLTTRLKLRVGGELVDAPAAPAAAAPARPVVKVWATGLVTALVLAGFVSFYASASPDGLEKVAADQGIDAKVEEHAAAGSPLADYAVKDVADERLSGGLAGALGVGATVAVGTGVFWLARGRRRTGAGAGAGARADAV
ncbi:energy-coupling factor ABC transporter permease [Streptomyces antimicrobicus]|uniref:Energy-coupling factor ABC transporter permease n=1 Tax=Streptomyces antimicrobicus TaxID=2883108 RepID=A0ABS8BAE2_9ACTN|nr:energy-coupling factor ABC transporter permease [Streptomyces antimicrobicus]MCB5181595.1 energy-coupling factor ABC transporter permease [Streptomyces antimicrobicus]